MAFAAVQNPDVDKSIREAVGRETSPALETSIKQLTDTNRALHSVVLELANLLNDRSRFAAYPLPWNETEPPYGPPDSYEVIGRTRNRSSLLVRPAAGFAAEDADISEPPRSFAEENEQARARHEERRQKEMNRLRSKVFYKCM
jgi:hypothetical protein